MHNLVRAVIRRRLDQPAVHLSRLGGAMDRATDARIYGTPLLFRETAGADEYDFA